MIKIDFGSRYYDDFQKVKSIIDCHKLFETGYNDDKQYYYTIYDKLIDPNTSPSEVAKRYINNLEKFFYRQLYNQDEKNLLIENIIEYLNNYADEIIYRLGRNDYATTHQPPKKKEYETWKNLSTEIIIKNRVWFSDNINSIINYLLKLKNELSASLNDSLNNFQPKFVNNFDSINTSIIWFFFAENLLDKGYIDKSILNEYLLHAFEIKSVPQNKFNLKNSPTKKLIYAVFYRYYKDIAGKPHGKQKAYASLLGDYFEGYKTSTVSTNFNKAIY